jgi:Macrocin-O-methyltransferase (TylF)
MSAIYDQDGLETVHNHDFLGDIIFRRAYERGVAAVGADYHWEWRVHVGLWVAFCASKLEGDFVECGVNRGFLSSAIMEDLGWNKLSRIFYLLDTFTGVDEKTIMEGPHTREEIEIHRMRRASGYYALDVEEVRRNFSQWRNVRIIQGPVPDTLPLVKAEQISYLHLDMNCAEPEVAALRYFWSMLVPGAMVLLDDYAYVGYESQKAAVDAVAKELEVRVLSLPTGQGLLVKPPG